MPKKKNYYFGEKEEQAVVDYTNAETKEEKERIFNTTLRKPFKIMIESILRRYPIHLGRHTIEDVENYALSHLIENMIKFDDNRLTKTGQKAKAYSYCQTIVRNFGKDHSKKTYIDKKTNLCFDDYWEEINEKIEYQYEITNNNEEKNVENLIDIIVEKINSILEENDQLKKNEIIVGEAIVNILSNWNILFMEETPEGKYNKRVTNKYQKNKILLYLQEMTELSTKEIRTSMKIFKDVYSDERENFFTIDLED